jgi:hypothetical protein
MSLGDISLIALMMEAVRTPEPSVNFQSEQNPRGFTNLFLLNFDYLQNWNKGLCVSERHAFYSQISKRLLFERN